MKLSLFRASSVYLRIVLLVVMATGAQIRAAAPVRVSITRRDLRPLPGVNLQVPGVANRQAVTDENGRAELPDLLQVPAGSYTYLAFDYLVKAAGDLTNYCTVEHQDQLIPNAEDHPEVFLPSKTLPADVGLGLDANPKEITAHSGDPVTIDIPVHNDGPQPARGLLVDYESAGVFSVDLDEVIHADRVVRPQVGGYIDVLDANETVTVPKHLVASTPGTYTNAAQITLTIERPDLLPPIAIKNVVLHVLPGPPPDLGITVNVDKSQVNVGECAIFTVTNRAAQPALNVWVRETEAVDTDFAFEMARSYGPLGDDRVSTASERVIPQIDPAANWRWKTRRRRKGSSNFRQ